jgi:radical SAM enzyme (TIGR01210 family)
MTRFAVWDNASILGARPRKNLVDPRRPYAYLVEPECAACGEVEDVATIFLTNRECPFRCLMCDLWRNTTDERVPVGAIPEQIDFALAELSPAKHVKLYNSGNFFDRQAIPREDYAAIAQRVASFQTVIVENHPKLCGDDCLRFRDLLAGKLEIAIGLETIHPEVLPRLNKQMTTDDFSRAVRFLSANEIATRAFILLRPPFLNEAEGVEWAVRSMQFAFDAGVQCCSVIPTRGGNGVMEQLHADGSFAPPMFSSLETVLEEGLAMRRGRVFVDLWDAERFFDCQRCGPARRDRLQQMNLTQKLLPAVSCDCEATR